MNSLDIDIDGDAQFQQLKPRDQILVMIAKEEQKLYGGRRDRWQELGVRAGLKNEYLASKKLAASAEVAKRNIQSGLNRRKAYLNITKANLGIAAGCLAATIACPAVATALGVVMMVASIIAGGALFWDTVVAPRIGKNESIKKSKQATKEMGKLAREINDLRRQGEDISNSPSSCGKVDKQRLIEESDKHVDERGFARLKGKFKRTAGKSPSPPKAGGAGPAMRV